MVIRVVTVSADSFGAFGVLVNTAASAIDAVLDLYDYYLHQNFQFIQSATTDGSQQYRQRYDIRTARRVRGEDRSLDFVITNNAAAGTSLVWSASSRLLLKGS